MEQEKICGKCPVCDDELAEGFLQAGSGMCFVKEPRLVRMGYGEGEFLLPSSVLKGTCLPARYCKQCESITISLK